MLFRWQKMARWLPNEASMQYPFRIPVDVFLGPGCLSGLPDYLAKKGHARILVISDPSVSQTGWFTSVAQQLPPHDLIVDVEPNPRVATVDRIAAHAKSSGVEVVLGIGGGSVIDAGKAVAMLLANDGSIMDFVGKNRFMNPARPFIAVPTTCGTGSEVTWVSVLSEPESGTKWSVKGDKMFPLAAFVDADVLATLPPSLIASTGMDAMTHAIEAFIARQANPASDALALQAIRLLVQFLGPCVRQPERPEYRARVMHASTLAGMAFGNADVGAVHCLSEGIGGMLDHPHGLLNTLLLVPVLRYQLPDIRERLKEISAFLGAPMPETLLERLDAMIGGFPLGTWHDLGISPDHFGDIARRAEDNGSNASNRRDMRAVDYHRILENLAR